MRDALLICLTLICTTLFPMAEIPTAPLNVGVSAGRISSGGTVTIMVTWMRPRNFGQFDIDRYDINVTTTSGIQQMATAPRESNQTMITVNVNENEDVQYTATVAARNLCGEIGAAGSSGKFSFI